MNTAHYLQQQVDVIGGFTTDQWKERLTDTVKVLRSKRGQLWWWRDFTWAQHHNSDWSLHRRTRYERIQTT